MEIVIFKNVILTARKRHILYPKFIYLVIICTNSSSYLEKNKDFFMYKKENINFIDIICIKH